MSVLCAIPAKDRLGLGVHYALAIKSLSLCPGYAWGSGSAAGTEISEFLCGRASNPSLEPQILPPLISREDKLRSRRLRNKKRECHGLNGS